MAWEFKMSKSLSPLNWRKTKSVSENDALIVDFIKHENSFYGNIGIVYEDVPNEILFTYYLTKSFDENDYRYFLRIYLFERKEPEFFEANIDDLTRAAIEKYNLLTRNDVINLGVKSFLG